MRANALIAMVLLSAVTSVAPVGAADKKPLIIEGTARVIDAGTLQIDKNVIRLFGIVAPGPRQKCLRGSLPWLCGAAARTYLVELADGKQARCEAVESFNARCIVGDRDLSNEMVRAGWAVADEAGTAYLPAEEKARAAKRGLWEYAPE
ncbi:MAG: thermonuclease family protein [Nisaea sp.]|jgi:endonuclease YncB( thermonuclease family)|uniref:thermonuclease family protein n=1 Tax=Nisaea sp. TaxID=2024842 RepID=UPI001B1D60AC|nr:thermonuclease family protein [Nisaea sp.]MBO6558934.1 thermonuclease family protein [Nisaea sp.]